MILFSVRHANVKPLLETLCSLTSSNQDKDINTIKVKAIFLKST